MNFFRIVLIIVSIIVVLIGGIVLAIPKSDTFEESIVTSSSEQVVESSTNEEKTSDIMTVAEVANPFQQNDVFSVSFSTEGDGADIWAISSKTHYDVNSSELYLPAASEFNTVGIDHANMGDNGTIVISHEYTFLNDCLILWNQGSAIDDINSWETHSSTIPVSRGQTVIVTYTSQDGGSSWVGKVNI